MIEAKRHLLSYRLKGHEGHIFVNKTGTTVVPHEPRCLIGTLCTSAVIGMTVHQCILRAEHPHTVDSCDHAYDTASPVKQTVKVSPFPIT